MSSRRTEAVIRTLDVFYEATDLYHDRLKKNYYVQHPEFEQPDRDSLYRAIHALVVAYNIDDPEILTNSKIKRLYIEKQDAKQKLMDVSDNDVDGFLAEAEVKRVTSEYAIAIEERNEELRDFRRGLHEAEGIAKEVFGIQDSSLILTLERVFFNSGM